MQTQPQINTPNHVATRFVNSENVSHLKIRSQGVKQ